MPQDEPQSAVENSVGFLDLLKNKTTLRLFIAIALIQGSHALITHTAPFFGQIMDTPFPMPVYFGESVY